MSFCDWRSPYGSAAAIEEVDVNHLTAVFDEGDGWSGSQIWTTTHLWKDWLWPSKTLFGLGGLRRRVQQVDKVFKHDHNGEDGDGGRLVELVEKKTRESTNHKEAEQEQHQQ